jgi:hypothetical protein
MIDTPFVVRQPTAALPGARELPHADEDAIGLVEAIAPWPCLRARFQATVGWLTVMQRSPSGASRRRERRVLNLVPGAEHEPRSAGWQEEAEGVYITHTGIRGAVDRRYGGSSSATGIGRRE